MSMQNVLASFDLKHRNDIARADAAGLPVIWRAAIAVSAPYESVNDAFDAFGTDKRQLYDLMTAAAAEIAPLWAWQDKGDMRSRLLMVEGTYTATIQRVLLSC